MAGPTPVALANASSSPSSLAWIALRRATGNRSVDHVIFIASLPGRPNWDTRIQRIMARKDAPSSPSEVPGRAATATSSSRAGRTPARPLTKSVTAVSRPSCGRPGTMTLVGGSGRLSPHERGRIDLEPEGAGPGAGAEPSGARRSGVEGGSGPDGAVDASGEEALGRLSPGDGGARPREPGTEAGPALGLGPSHHARAEDLSGSYRA